MSRFALSLRGWLALGLVALPAVGQERAQSRYESSCETLSGNLVSDENVCVEFEFSDGTTEISAGIATTSRLGDFDGTVYRLSDGVRLSFETTEVLADEAVLEFENNELVRGELTGSPVVMSDYIEERGEAVRGTAESITYDRRAGMLGLNGRSTLTIGDNEFMGCNWAYNFNEKTYDAGATDDCNGVQFRLTPPEDGDDPEDASGPP